MLAVLQMVGHFQINVNLTPHYYYLLWDIAMRHRHTKAQHSTFLRQ